MAHEAGKKILVERGTRVVQGTPHRTRAGLVSYLVLRSSKFLDFGFPHNVVAQ